MQPSSPGPRVLVFTFPVAGHVTPLVPVVLALTARRASVVVASGAAYAARFVDAGALVVPHPAGFDARVKQPSTNFLQVASQLADESAGAMLSFALEQISIHRPAVVVADSMAPWGRLAAELRGVSVVTSTPSFIVEARLGLTPRAALDAAAHLITGLRALGALARQRRNLRRQFGVDCGGPVRLLSNRGAATIVHTSAALQPGAARFGRDVNFVGASAAERVEPGARASAMDPDLAELLKRAAEPSHRLAYLSLGTIYNERPAFLRQAVDALSGPGRSVVVSLGDRVHVSALGPLPPGVVALPRPPQLAVLDRASVFVTHGGLGSVHEALWRGVPMIVFPQAADQPAVANRLERLGAAVVLRGRDPQATSIRDAEAVLRGSAAADRAAELGAGLRTGGGASAAADVVLSLAEAESGCVRRRSPQES